tara:strand:+ start:4247 stop:7441 length:3195 start_codon:yes stop_codon:yes gene_type:complete
MADKVKKALKIAAIIYIGVKLFATEAFLAKQTAFKIFSGATAVAAKAFAYTLALGVLSKGINATGGNFGSKVSSRAPTEPRQIIYGQTRVGGTITHISTTGTDNHLLHLVFVLAGHEVNSLEAVILNDETLTVGSPVNTNGSDVFTATNSKFTNTDNPNHFGSGRLVRFTFQDGSQTGVDGFMDQQLAAITSDDKYTDMAYVYMQCVFDAEKFGGGMPNVSFVVKGKKVYDPRLNSGSGGTAWSDNPALIVRDYLTDTTYGLKAKSSEINDGDVAGGITAAANTCDLSVNLSSGTEKKYTANGFTNFAANGAGVLNGLLQSMAGSMSYVNGQFQVHAGAHPTPSLTITDDDLLQPLEVSTKSSTGDLYNTVKSVFVDGSNNYVAADAPIYQDSTFLTEDTPNGTNSDKPNYVKTMEKQLPFTVTHTMAQRLQRISLNKQRLATTIGAVVDLKFLRLQPHDTVMITNERLGYTSKIFEVLSAEMLIQDSEDVPTLAVGLVLQETASSVYDFATSDYQTPVASGSTLTVGDYAISPPTNLSVDTDTTTVDVFSTTSVTVTWSNASSPYIIGTEVLFKRNSDSVYSTMFANQGSTKQQITGLEIGVQYNFKVRHLSAGSHSDFTSQENHTVGGTARTLAEVLNANATGIKTFLQNNVPTSVNAGDLWIDSNDGNKIYRATSSGNTAVASGQWVLTTITAGAIGLGNVLNQAQVTTFASDNPPTSTAVGDLWIDTNDGNKIYRAQSAGADQVTSGEWVLTTLTKAGIGLGNVADERQITIFREDNPPTATAVGDLWYDTNDNNRQYRASATGSSNWVEVSPNKSTVGLDNVANERQVTIFRQTSVPTATAAGDLWVDTDDGNKLYRATAAGNNSVTTNQWVLVNVTKAGIGLGNVDNNSTATILSGNLTGGLNFSGTTVSVEDMIDAKVRAFAGFDSSGNVNREVPQAQLTNVVTASVNQQAFVWTELSNAGFSPSATSFTFEVTWKNGAGTTVAESRWVATRDTTNDHIDNSGITNNYTAGGVSSSGVTSSVVGGDSTFMAVTFTKGGTSITLSASLITFTGFTFKE